ncbi:MAG: NUDIX domain-containing protein [Clostridia bacterium]|nr:NUDIX domain-containing protein [Clostridia bacterium]
MKYVTNKEEGIIYTKRPGAYAIVVEKNSDKVGIVTNGKDYFYLGGGIEEGETNLQALARELIEEAGSTLKNIKEFESVGDYIYDEEKGYFDVVANVYIAEFDQKITEPIEKDHFVIWVNPEEYADRMCRPWQKYIMQEYIKEYRK